MINKVSSWMGIPVDQLDKDELIKVVEWCGQEIQRLQKDRDRWRDAGDPLKYLLKGKQNVPAAV